MGASQKLKDYIQIVTTASVLSDLIMTKSVAHRKRDATAHAQT